MSVSRMTTHSLALALAEFCSGVTGLGPVRWARAGLADRFRATHHPQVAAVPKTRKVLFLHPTTPLGDGRLYGERRVYTPALALPLLAALTPPHWDVELCYETSEPVPWDTAADVVAITSMGHSLWRGLEIAREFRRRGKHVAMGGTMASLIPDFVQPHVDSVFVGDAEATWPEFLADFEAGRARPRYGPLPPVRPLTLPVPRYDLLIERPTVGPFLPIQVARGCPNRCRFCTVSSLSDGCYRPRSIEEILRDLRSLTDLGFRFFFLLNDNLAGDLDFARRLFAAIRPLGIRWASQATLDILQPEGLLEEAVEAGCMTLCFGLETLTQAALGDVDKGFLAVADYDRRLRRIQASGLLETAEFIIGLDQDTPETIRDLGRYIDAQAIAIVRSYILAPIPGTPLWHEFKDQGRLLGDGYSQVGGASVGFRPVHFAPEELLAAYWDLQDHVFSWRSILRRILHRPWRSWLDPVLMLLFNLEYRRQVRRRVIPGQA